MVRLPVPGRRHRDQHPVQERDHLDADDLRAADLPDRRSCPAPLPELSPWLDRLVDVGDGLFARLAAQQHRRFIKTHTPLDGIPSIPGATYIVVARHPLDMAVSLYHQGDNIDRDRLRQLTGQPAAERAAATAPAAA